MVRLAKLEMVGFKSFLSRTEFIFDKDVTAVVGPNGCGKSNIGDALNWVIGEQSVKTLRGDRMEDVIFNGSEGRRPLGMAEVSLHLRNGVGDPSAQEEIVITRRLFRSGESEYLLNNQRSRLKDIQETLAQINVGSGVYAIIEQGKVDAALSSRPRERRILIEEAAGIALYKSRKRQAEAKLEATEANLLRVNDIVVEIERQIGSLKRQAARARRYGRLTDEIARQERILLFHEHSRLEELSRGVAQREAVAREDESEAAATLARLEAAFESSRGRLDEQDGLWKGQSDLLHGVDREMDRHERESVVAREQTDESATGIDVARAQAATISARLADLAAQIESRRAERVQVESAASVLRSESERLETERRAEEEEVRALESGLTQARSDFLQAIDTLSEARNRRALNEESRGRATRRLGSLDREQAEAAYDLEIARRSHEQLRAELAKAESDASSLAADLAARQSAMRAGEATLARETARREECRLKQRGLEERLRALQEIEDAALKPEELLSGVVAYEGILADTLRVPRRLEPAVEIYLGAFLEAAVVASPDAAFDGIRALKHRGKGRAAFLPAMEAGGDPGQPAIAVPDQVRSDPATVGRLGDLVEAGPRLSGTLAAALGRAIVVEDLEAARRLRRVAPFFDYVTLAGDILHTSGLIEGGAQRPHPAGPLTRRRAKEDAVLAIETGRAHLGALDTLISGLQEERAAAAVAFDGGAAELAEREKDLAGMRVKVEAAGADQARALTKQETIGQESAAAGAESAALESERALLEGSVAELESAQAEQEARIRQAQDEIARRRESIARLGEALIETKSSHSASGQRLESIDTDLARLLETDADLTERLETEVTRQADLAARLESAKRRQAEATEALADLASRRAVLEASVKDGEEALARLRLETEGIGQQARSGRGALDEARSLREKITLEGERVAADLRHLAAGAAGSDGAALEDLLSGVTDEERAQDPEVARTALDDLRRRRDGLGPVNMIALEQYQELEQRHGFMAAQRDDLTRSIASLKETIARINRTSRERFLQAFEAVRGEFNGLFRGLFGGGRADLRLMTEDADGDVLECGIEIIAQPPGKRLQSVTLLSGGEKALTAIALLFAIFKYRPSPFCLLDEVDAPLDEANVMRFNDLLKSMASSTQFVMITHNRCSMETADMLYGITMEEPGVSRSMSVVLDGSQDRREAAKTLPEMMAAKHKGNGRRGALRGPAIEAAPQGGGNGGGPDRPSAGLSS